MVILLSDPESPLRRKARADACLDITARHLATGALYWASSDMAALATASARALDTVRWTVDARPAPTGLMVMDGGVGWLPHNGADFPVDALSWGPAPGGLLLATWCARQRLDDNLARHGARIEHHQVPPLVPMTWHTVPVGEQERPVGELPDEIRTVATILAAAWYLMDQPTLADRQPVDVDRTLRRAYVRAERPEPEVTLIDLRAVYRPTDPDQQPDSEPGRWSHRWVVQGHWRQQPHGPARSQRKRIWIADYVKGPDGAPLLTHERVNVWRR